jgi:precorrin-3B synthase
MNAPQRRLACPGLTDPMETGDGFLARLVPSGQTITLDAFASLCAAARAYGNGIIEVTARGSIQVRGLKPETISAFAADVGTLDIATEGVPMTVDPLAGLAPHEAIDTRAMAGALRTALARAPLTTRLGPKVSVVIDAGSTLHLDQLAADIRLRPESTGQCLHVMLGGDAFHATSVGAVPLAMATDVTLRTLDVIARHGRKARARDLIGEGGLAAFRAALGPSAREAPPPTARPPSEPIGVHALRGGNVALGIGLAFGHTDTNSLERLIDAAKTSGADGLRTAHRSLLVIGLSAQAASNLAAVAEQLGFVTQLSDPRRHIATCAGAPICSAAQIPTRALAPTIAKAAPDLLDGSFVLHLSGCAKGCAHHADSALTIVGNSGGCGVVLDGAASDMPIAGFAVETLSARLAALAHKMAQTRRQDESTAKALARLGKTCIAAALSEAGHG